MADESGAHTLKEKTRTDRAVPAYSRKWWRPPFRVAQSYPRSWIGTRKSTILMRRWERARQGDGQFSVVVGEPGLGKSRLIEEFHSRLSDTPHTLG